MEGRGRDPSQRGKHVPKCCSKKEPVSCKELHEKSVHTEKRIQHRKEKGHVAQDEAKETDGARPLLTASSRGRWQQEIVLRRRLKCLKLRQCGGGARAWLGQSGCSAEAG